MRIARLAAAVALAACAATAAAQQKEIKIGFIYDVSGPFAGGGSEAAQIGTKAAIDMVNEKGGVSGYKINALFVDAQLPAADVDVLVQRKIALRGRRRRKRGAFGPLRARARGGRRPALGALGRGRTRARARRRWAGRRLALLH